MKENGVKLSRPSRTLTQGVMDATDSAKVAQARLSGVDLHEVEVSIGIDAHVRACHHVESLMVNIVWFV